MKEANQIQNPVPLGFRVDELPDDPGTVYDQGRKPLKDIHLREIWADDLARTLWLAIKSRHITSQYFKREIQEATASLRRVPPKSPIDLHYRIHGMTRDHWDDRTKERSDCFCEELFRYVMSVLDGGKFKLEWTEPPPVQIEGNAVFARNRTLRMQLRRWWVERPKRWAAWMMLNPSDAGEKRNDPTMLRVIHFTRSWGYDGCIAVNLYPFISSDPREMWQWSQWEKNGPDWYARDDMQGNLAQIEEVGRMSCLRVVAFGAQAAAKDPNWIEQCVEAFEQPFDYPDSKWQFMEDCVCLGTTKDGQPIHPLARGKNRVPNDAQPILWRPRE